MNRIDGEPGFTEESFNFLKKKAAESEDPVFISVVFDEISIMKHISFDGRKFVGGTGKFTCLLNMS